MADNMNESVLTGSNETGKPNFKNRKPRFFVTKAGLVGVRGINGVKPMVLYKDQWDTLYRLFESGHLENFMEKNEGSIKIRQKRKQEETTDSVENSEENVVVEA